MLTHNHANLPYAGLAPPSDGSACSLSQPGQFNTIIQLHVLWSKGSHSYKGGAVQDGTYTPLFVGSSCGQSEICLKVAWCRCSIRENAGAQGPYAQNTCKNVPLPCPCKLVSRIASCLTLGDNAKPWMPLSDFIFSSEVLQKIQATRASSSSILPCQPFNMAAHGGKFTLVSASYAASRTAPKSQALSNCIVHAVSSFHSLPLKKYTCRHANTEVLESLQCARMLDALMSTL